jgi:biopolymer transport protein ExbB/TolQ/biopolymer transport protein ExbD
MPGACANPWQTYDCEWGFGYLWRWMDWLGRGDIIVLALMLLCVIGILTRSLYRCHLARHQTRTFMRDAGSALRSGALDDASRLAQRNGNSPVAAMVATWVATVTSDSTTFSLAESVGVASRAFWRSQRNVTAKFIFGLGTLQSIAYTAPFLGLAGACELILNGAFRGFGMEKHAVMVMLISGIATSLVSTAVGLLVAMAAAFSYNYVRERAEMLDSEMSQNALYITRELNAHLNRLGRCEPGVLGPSWYKPWKLGQRFQLAQSQPLRKRFSEMPPYGLLATPGLAFAVAAFMIIPSFNTPMGLGVRLLKVGEGLRSNSSSIPVIVIRLSGTGANRRSILYVNTKETPWEKLDATVKSEPSINSQRVVYVEAEDEVPWQTVANAIDVINGVPANVVLLTVTPAPNRTLVRGLAHRQKH